MIRFVDNVNVKMADILCELLPSSRRVEVAVALARYSGLRLIQAAMDRCLRGGVEIEFVVGLDFRTTDAEPCAPCEPRNRLGCRYASTATANPPRAGQLTTQSSISSRSRRR